MIHVTTKTIRCNSLKTVYVCVNGMPVADFVDILIYTPWDVRVNTAENQANKYKFMLEAKFPKSSLVSEGVI